jgi:hypothetical protein
MQARLLPARHGFLWLLASYRIFRSNPPLVTVLMMAYLFAAFTFLLIPYIGLPLLSLAKPALAVVLASGYRAIERRGGISAVALTYDTQKRRVELIRLGGIHLIGSLMLALLADLVIGGGTAVSPEPETVDAQKALTTLALLLVASLPLLAAFWFAPLLTAWDEIAPLKAVFFSLVASLRNWRAFAVYALVTGIISILLPGMLLLAGKGISDTAFGIVLTAVWLALSFFVAPIMMVSTYVSYQDVFHGKASGD